MPGSSSGGLPGITMALAWPRDIPSTPRGPERVNLRLYATSIASGMTVDRCRAAVSARGSWAKNLRQIMFFSKIVFFSKLFLCRSWSLWGPVRDRNRCRAPPTGMDCPLRHTQHTRDDHNTHSAMGLSAMWTMLLWTGATQPKHQKSP